MDIFETDDNSTPLTEEEKQDLKTKWVTTREELNNLETKGIDSIEDEEIRQVILDYET